MKKLKLQMQITIDGFVAGPDGQLDWMTWDWDDEIKNYVNDLTNTTDTILMGRKMTDGFVTYWEEVAKDKNNKEYPFAKQMVDYPKIVFTKTLDKSRWNNTTLAKGDITEEVGNIKKKSGKDIIVYGGAGFVSGLIEHNLIDEYYLFVNPAAIGSGMRIFHGNEKFQLIEVKPFECGVTVMKYKKAQ